MALGEEDSGRSLQLVPGSHGQNVPNACTIVIIAGRTQYEKYNENIYNFLKSNAHLHN